MHRFLPSLASIALSALLTLSCASTGDEPPPADAHASDAHLTDIVIPEGEVLIAMGNYEDSLYTPFESSGSELIIANGIQGGEWIMPALRMLGGESKAVVTCSLTTDSGEIVGESFMTVKFFPADDGWQEIKFYPVRIERDDAHASEPLSGIFGQGALLEVSVVDDAERVGSVTYAVILSGE